MTENVMSEEATELSFEECELIAGGGQTISGSGGKTEDDGGGAFGSGG